MPVSSGTLDTLDVRTRAAWRRWLSAHHDSSAGIWLVCHKRHTGVTGVDYETAVEEALCFGWIDSLVKRLDDDRFLRKFTPRKAASTWSASNRRRYAKIEAEGRLAPAGRARRPGGRDSVPPPIPDTRWVEAALKTNRKAWARFQELAPSHRRRCLAWIALARRDDTRQRRLREATRLLAAGRALGLK